MIKKVLLLFVLLAAKAAFAQIVGPPPPPCWAPTALIASNVTPSSAVIGWTDNYAYTAWDILVQPAGFIAPTDDTTPTYVEVTVNPFIVTGLVCGTTYDVYIRASAFQCPAGFGLWSEALTYTTSDCAGQPNNLVSCSADGQTCFDLTQNDAALLEDLDPQAYTVSYHHTAADAYAEVNPIASPYCIGTHATEEVYARVEDNATGIPFLTVFNVSSGSDSCDSFTLDAFLDLNANGVKDAGEPDFPLGNYYYGFNGGSSTYVSGGNSTYVYDANNANSYAVGFEIDPAYSAIYQLNTSAYADVHTSSAGTVYYFAITTNPITDVAVALALTSPQRPGFIHTQTISITNYGTINAAGTVTYVRDPAFTVASTSVTATPTADGFTVDYTDLQPFETRFIFVQLSVPVLPNVSLNQATASTVSITANDDVNLTNNSTTVHSTIVAAYDPNDKMEAHGHEILADGFGADEPLTYTIRFENTGDIATEFIRIVDVLDAQLDASTARLVASSHPCVMVREGQQLQWRFDSLQLPPVSQDDLTIGHGFVTFSVQPTVSSIGTVIPNEAAIYFDYNPAIVTNMFETHFVETLSVDHMDAVSVSIYPNPVDQLLHVIAPEAVAVSVYNLAGQQVVLSPSTNNPSIDVSALPAGIYLLRASNDSGYWSRKVVKR